MPEITEPLITAIIPVRLSKDSLYDEVERIERIAKTLPAGYELVIVDYGTSVQRAHELATVSQKHGARLVRVETEGQPFSIGAARDIGTQQARTPLVVYHDIDFLMSADGYKRVLMECRLRGMPENAYAFFALPGIYLTQSFTKRYLELHSAGDGNFADLVAHDGVIKHDKSVYDSHTYAISAIVANRYHLLAIGGHDKSFTGHGAEDFELMHRLSSYYRRGPRPRDYYLNTRNNSILKYEGFRAFYALYGIDVFQRGIAIVHLWHPRREEAGYVGTSNQTRVSKSMADYDRGLTFIFPLEDVNSTEMTLVLVDPSSMPSRALRHIYPALGRFRSIPERSFTDALSLCDFIKAEGFTRVFFLNPYGNAHRLSLYQGVKAAGIRFIAYDRGALPDSWFFDSKGFLGESDSYARTAWDHPLSDRDREAILDWFQAFNREEQTLEINGPRTGADHLRRRLPLGDRKVIFVALQRPSDTATVYFSGACKDAATFNDWVAQLAATLDPRKYVVVVKKHPLETVKPAIDGVVFADDNAHIRDLIDLADKVVLINSGSGLIAAALGKPVICCGQAFYQHSGFAFAATSAAELIELSTTSLSVDNEVKLRFMKYLVFDYYSFGKTEYSSKVEPDGSLRRLATRTAFSEIRGLTPTPLRLGAIPEGHSLNSPIFHSFGGANGVKARPKVVPFSRRALMPIVRPFVRAIGNQKDLQKFNADPAAFFANLRNPLQRNVGALLFGTEK